MHYLKQIYKHKFIKNASTKLQALKLSPNLAEISDNSLYLGALSFSCI